MKVSVIFLLAAFSVQQAVLAQGDPPFVSPEEQKAIEVQNGEFNRALELTVMYTWTQRNMPDATFTPSGTPPGACAIAGSGFGPCLQTPYQLQSGNLLRFQLQWSF